jgi:hypothetical protein
MEILMKLLARSFVLATTLVLGLPTLHAAPQLSSPLALPGDTQLSPPAGDQTNVAIARGAVSSLLVWEDSRASLAGTQSGQGYGFGTQITDVYAARVDGAGNTIDVTPIQVATGAFAQSVPKVAWNGQNWLVVWTSRTPGQFFSTLGVYAARVSPAGQLLDDPPIAISDTLAFDEREPVVASDGVRWAVVWKGLIAQGTDAVRGCLVDASGIPDAPRDFFQTVGGVGFYIPWNFELAFAGGRYLFVSEHMRQGRSDDDVLGQLFDGNLVKVGGEFAISTNPWNQNRAAVASNGAGFFVTWCDEQMWGEVRGSPVTAGGVVTVPDGAVYQTAMYGSYPYPAAGWDGANWIAAWDDGGPIQVARVSPAGAMLPGSPVRTNAGTWSRQQPAIGTLNAGVLVAWSDSRNFVSPMGPDTTDLYGAVVDPAGGVAADQPLLLSPPAQTRPDLAGNAASGFLVTFLSETAGTASVMAQRVDALGTPVDPQPILIASGTRWVRNPAVGWDGAVWLVVWEELTTAWPPGSGTIFARRVAANGIPIDPSPIQVMAGNTPDVAAAGGVFLVVGSVEPTNHFRPIRGARVRGSDGAVLDATAIAIGPSYSVSPAVTAFADRWLVAWQQHTTHDSPYSSIQASFVLANGTVPGAFVAGNNTSTCRTPSLASGGTTALLSWSDGSNVRARRVQADGTALDPSAGFGVSSAFNTQFGSDVGWNGARWFVAWNDYRAHTNILDGAVGDVYGSRVDPDGTVADPAGIAVADDFAVAEGNPAVAGDLGVAVAAWAMVRQEAPFGTFRITLRNLDDSSSFSPYCFGDGTLATACPCGNTGAAEHGCANSRNASGAVLGASGGTSPDTVVLHSSGELPSALSIFIQGNVNLPGGLVFGDGVRCAGGTIRRIAVRNAVGGTVSFPGPGDPSISARSASLGDPIAPGTTRYYQTYYRDPSASFCPGATFNVSSGMRIDW